MERTGQLPDGRYCEQIELVAHDVDLNNRLKVSSVFSHVQEVANAQCVHFHVGHEELMERFGLCYVLTRMRFVMESYPTVGEKVRVCTWPDNKLRVVFTRYFTLHGADDRLIGSAVSNWVLFDTRRRALAKPQDYGVYIPVDTSGVTPPQVMPKGTKFDFVPAHTALRQPVYSDFDYNRHVNNARYVEWICDVLPLELLKRQPIREIDIKYDHEIGLEAFLEQPEAARALRIDSAYDKNEFSVRGTGWDQIVFFECKGTFFQEEKEKTI